MREIGGLDLATTDLVNARSLLEKNPKAFKLIETCPADRPLAVQLFGSVPEEMRDAAVYLESIGISSVDINMGCPVSKVCKVGGGSAMMTELDKTSALVKGMVDAVKIPVTAKMRLGWDDDNLTAPDLGPRVGGCRRRGDFCSWPHARTRLFRIGQTARHSRRGAGGEIDPGHRQRRCDHVRSRAKMMFDETGCAGVSIGRGAFYNPWIFAHTQHYLKTGELLPEPAFEERVRVMCRHLDLMVEVFGEATRLPHVPQSGAVVFETVRPGQ